MRLTHRLALRMFIVAALLISVALFITERRVVAHLHDPASGIPALVADSMLERVRRDLVVVGLLLIAAAAGAAGMLARPVARPLEELRDDAVALAGGHRVQRPAVRGSGEVAQLAESLRQLSQQVDARERALVAEEELLVALTESLNEGVVAVNARQQVVRINQTARQLLRLKEPVPFPADYLPRDRTLREALAAVLSGVEALPGEVRVEDRSLSLTARPLPAGGAVLALYDLTPFRRLEAVRRDFVANVSHELRTPLTVISGFVETLQDDDLPPDLRQQFLVMAEGNVRRMQRIVDDLLDLSRIESGGWLPNPVEQNFAALAAEIVGPLQETAQAKGVALRIEMDREHGTLYADPTAVRQILSNLTENALRHTMSGEVVLFCRTEPAGTWIGVRDTGIGITADHLPRIFERFYRADPGRSREAGGTGLGLAIVRHLAEAHGGVVRAESVPTVGTTIAALFPHAERVGPSVQSSPSG